MMIISDSALCNGLQKGVTGFQFIEFGNHNSSMALSYEHFSDWPTTSPRSLCV